MTRLTATLLLAMLLAAACADTGAPGEEDTLPTVLTTRAATTSTPVTVAPPTTAAVTTTTTALSTTTTTRSRSGPGYGGEAVVADDQEPPTLNPYAPGGDNFVVTKVAQAHMTGVWDIDGATLQLVPEVVTELPTVGNGGVVVNPDGTMTVRYQVRDEAVWADGVPISGEDLAFTAETLIAAWRPDSDDAPWDEIIPGSIVAGDKTLELTLRRPTILYEQLFRWILPKHDVAGTDLAADWHERAWVAGGPFIFESWERGRQLTLVRNPNYWKTDPATGLQLPYLDRLTFRFIPETATLIRAFGAREVDVINPPPSPETIADLERLEPDGARVDVRPGPIWEHFNFQFGENNRNDRSLNRHLRFRQAVAHALDRDLLIERAVRYPAPRLDSYVRAFTPGFATDAWAQYPSDPAAARALLADLCADLGRDCAADPPTLAFSTTSNGDVRYTLGHLLPDMLAEVGIEVELQLEDSSLYFGDTLDRGSWDVGLWAWVGTPGLAGLVSIHDVFDPDGPPPQGNNFYRWGTPAVTGAEGDAFDQGPSLVRDEHTARFAELVDAMGATVDPDEIVALIREAERLLADQAVIIPLYARLDPGAVWADQIGGYVHNPSQASDLWNVELWYRVDR